MIIFIPMKARRAYLFLALALLCIEVFIALFVHDRIIRPYIGDLLAVMLVYFLIRSVTSWNNRKSAVVAFFFACGIELLQYINLVGRAGLRGNRGASIVVGQTFDWTDILMYATGTAVVLVAEYVCKPTAERN
jgi:hypothetical protein